jgi:hypothetical protein
METLIVNDGVKHPIIEAPMLDLSVTPIHGCIGCWSCWWATPGRCVHKDLDTFYRQYLAANRVIFLAKLGRGFISGNLKSLFDRMLPLFLPYTVIKDGGSFHVPRYERYPDIEFYYDGSFEGAESEQLLRDYIHKVFDQFYSKNIKIMPLSDFAAKEEL